MKKGIILVVSLVLLVASVFSVPALAQGVAMGPATVEVEDALRGGEYSRTLSVFNPGSAAGDIYFRVDGEVAGWLSLHNWETGEPVDQVSIEGQGKATILVKINIPVDIANGVYTATVYAETAPVDLGGEEGAAAVMQASSEFTIKVSDTQIIAGTVGSITGLDTEVGMPWRLEVVFRNTGNVSVNPGIDCQISQNGNPSGELHHADTTIAPGATETIQVEWDTTGQEIGDYLAEVEVFLGDNEVGGGSTGFALLPVGALTREGTLTEISIGGGRAVVGNLMTVLAEFANTGQIDTRAKFFGEVHLDGELIEVLESDELLVPVGESTILKSYLELEQEGEYQISGYVNYEGKKTEVKTFSFPTVAEVVGVVSSSDSETAPSVNQPASLWPIIVGGILGVLVLAIIIVLTVPWAILQPARRMIIAQGRKLRFAGKLSIWGWLHK